MKDVIISQYDKESKIYDKTRYIENKYRYYTAYVAENLISKFLKEGSILELGVGTGRFALPLSAKYRYIGIDISKGMLSVAKKKLENNKNVNLILMDAEKLGFKNESFDNIICVHTFKFFPNPIRVLRECYRVLKEGGRVIISTESKDRFLQSFTFKKEERNYIRKKYKMGEMDNLLKKAGFKLIFCKKIFIFPITLYKVMPKIAFAFIWRLDNLRCEAVGNEVFIVGEKN